MKMFYMTCGSIATLFLAVRGESLDSLVKFLA